MSLFKKIFGRSQDLIWQQLSAELGGQYIKGSFLKGGSKVLVKRGNWTVVLDTYTVSTGKSTVTYTRMRAPFVTADGFQFSIHRKTMLSSVGKLFGMQDVEVGGPKFKNLEPLLGLPGYLDPQVIESGDQDFDADFVIKGNNETKIRDLFKQIKIRDLIQAQPALQLQIKHDKRWLKRNQKEEVHMLYFVETGVIRELDRLKQLFALFEEVLDALHELGTASKKRLPKQQLES